MNPDSLIENIVDADLLNAVISIARDASAAIMNVYAGEFTVDHKSDHSPLTQADKAAHHIITTALQKLTPEIPVLSEESPAEFHDFATRRRWSRFWLVDPLDGTREFVQRNGEFTVNIALIKQHQPVLGVIAVPASGIVYSGAQGLGAQRIVDKQVTTRINSRKARPVPTIVGSRSHRGDSLNDFLVRLGAHQLCSVGSSLKFCRVAEGSADCYPRLSPTSEWDTGAGQAIVEAAGGAVFDLSGQVLSYNRRESLLNPHFIVVGDPQFAWRHLIG
ncbi:MAG: 3'(2'),5'-bisphosphate nucleotidase CysQ [Steroidobacter sp.]